MEWLEPQPLGATALVSSDLGLERLKRGGPIFRRLYYESTPNWMYLICLGDITSTFTQFYRRVSAVC